MSLVYIAGPMRGYPEHNYPAFRAAAVRLRALGLDVLSPVEFNHPADDDGTLAPADYLQRALLSLVARCDGIALLDGWRDSIGARCEVAIAVSLGFVFYDAETGEQIPAPDSVTIWHGYGSLVTAATRGSPQTTMALGDPAPRRRDAIGEGR